MFQDRSFNLWKGRGKTNLGKAKTRAECRGERKVYQSLGGVESQLLPHPPPLHYRRFGGSVSSSSALSPL